MDRSCTSYGNDSRRREAIERREDRHDNRSSEEDAPRCFKNTNNSHVLLSELNSQRKTGEFLDFVVEVDGRKFPCHRAVMASNDYFKTMLHCNLAESNSNFVRLHRISSTSFSKILDFVYTGEINISKDDVQDILQTAHMLLFETIVLSCRAFIQDNLCLSNCVDVMYIADLYGFSDLKKKAMDLVVSFFSDVRQSEEFLGLSMQAVVDLFSDKDLQVTNEDDVVHSLIKWLNHDPEGRKSAVASILPAIRLSHVRVSALRKLESHAVVQELPECLARITAAKEEHLSGIQQLHEGTGGDEDREGHRKGKSDDLAIIVGGWREVKQQRDGEDRQQSMKQDWYWLLLQNLPLPPLPDFVPLRSIICIDPDSHQYYHIAGLPTPVSGYMGVASSGRRLYVTGGRTSPLIGQGPHSAPSRLAFRYDFNSDTWTKLPDMPRGRAEHHSVVVDGKLFLVGGDVETTSEISSDCLDLEKDAWIKPPSLPKINRSSKLTVTSCGGKLIIMEAMKRIEAEYKMRTGFCSLTLRQRRLFVHAYDLKSEYWVCSDILLDRVSTEVDFFHIFTIAVDNKLYFRSTEVSDRNVYIYDARESTLTTEIGDGQVFTGTFYRTEWDIDGRYIFNVTGIMDIVMKYKFEGSVGNDAETPLPFALFGHTFIGTKKSSVGWYCRDFVKMENEDGEDETDCTDGAAGDPLYP